jgi:ankyrin repeat protein
MGAGSLALMKVLLRFNPNISTVNAQDQSGATALLTVLSYHETCNVVRESYTMPLVELLLAHGADRTAYDKKGQTALHKLAASPSYDDPISPDLLEKFIPSVHINKADVNGWTALHWMASNLRQVEASRLLVHRGADVDAVNKRETRLSMKRWEAGS